MAQLEWPVRHADQAIDREPDMLEHAPDLAVLALAQREGEPSIVALGPIQPGLNRPVGYAVDSHALCQRLQPSVVNLAEGARTVASQPACRGQLQPTF